MTHPATQRQLAKGQHVLQPLALKAGDDVPTKLEVILSGTYKTRKFALTEKQIDEMIANHAAAGVDPAIDREHESWLSFDATPAMGWVKTLSKAPSAEDPSRTALVAEVEWTDLGQEAVAKKHYRYISAGIDFESLDRMSGKKLGAFLDHVALVKHPYVQHMQPLASSAVEGGAGDKPMKAVIALLALGADADEAAVVEAIQKREGERVKLGEKLELAQKRIVALEAEALDGVLTAAVKEFKITAAERKSFEEMLAAEELSAKALRKIIDAREPKPPEPLKLKNKPPATDKLARARQVIETYRAANPKATYADAYLACSEADPDLFTEEQE